MSEIKPEDMRPGDRVRIVESVEVVVKRAPEDNGGWLSILTDAGTFFDKSESPDWTRTWELIERPKPEPKLGSVWVDPEDGRRFVALSGGCYANEAATWIIRPGAPTIARLVPAEGEA